MATRKLEVEFIGDTSNLNKAFGKANRSVDQFGKNADDAGRKTSKLSGAFGAVKVGGLAAAAGIGGAVVVMSKLVKAAQESQVSQKQMQTQLKALGISYEAHAKQIDKVIQKTSQLSGLDDEDLQGAFTNIVRTTGNVTKALKLTGLAADFARAKHLDVAKAGEIVAKVAGGNTGILSRYGITIQKGASSTEALGLLQQKFAGQAKAYGETSAGAQDRFRVAVENLEEALGKKLLPIVTSVTNFLATFINGLSNGDTSAGGFAATMRDVGKSIGEVVSGFKAAWDLLKPLTEQVWPAIVQIIQGQLEGIRGIIKIFAGLLKGDFGQVWDGVKLVFQGALDHLLGMLKLATAPFRAAGKALGEVVLGALKALWDDFSAAGRAITDRIANGIKTVTGALSGAGAWIRDRVVNMIREVAGSFGDAGSWITDRIANGIKTVTTVFGGVGGWIVDRVTNQVHETVKDLQTLGGWFIDQFVAGIKAAGKAIDDAASWLKDKVVGAVKHFFGIDSPSKVMMELGGHLATGLIKGIVGGDVTGFIRAHFKSVGDLAQTLVASGWKGLGDFFSGGAKPGSVGPGGEVGGGADAWLAAALKITGHFSPENLLALHGRMMQESGGNPNAINLWDSNAAAGHPSKGLLQTIDSTFQAYRLKSLPNDIYNPIANAVAAIRYMYAVYGHIVGPSGTGYAAGTTNARKGWKWVGEQGPELMRFNGGEQVLSNTASMAVGGGTTTVIEHHYHGPVVQDRDFVTYLQNQTANYGRRNGRNAFGG